MLIRLCAGLALVLMLGCGAHALPLPVSRSAHHHVAQYEFYFHQFWRRDLNTVNTWRSPGREVCKAPVAVPKGFKAYRSAESALRVNLPARPTLVVQEGRANVIDDQFDLERGHVHYLAAHGHPAWMRPQRNDIPAGVMAALERKLAGRVTRSEVIRCNGFQGVDFTLALDDDNEAHGRVYSHPQAFYLLLAQTTDKQPLPREAELFLDTFRPHP